MPRGIPNAKPVPVATPEPLEAALDDIRMLLEARQSEYQSAANRISDILATLNPKPKVGRPKVRA